MFTIHQLNNTPNDTINVCKYIIFTLFNQIYVTLICVAKNKTLIQIRRRLLD